MLDCSVSLTAANIQRDGSLRVSSKLRMTVAMLFVLVDIIPFLLYCKKANIFEALFICQCLASWPSAVLLARLR